MQNASRYTSVYFEGRVEPSISFGVNGRERHATVCDFELRLILQHQCARDSVGDGLGESDHCIMRDDRPGLERC